MSGFELFVSRTHVKPHLDPHGDQLCSGSPSWQDSGHCPESQPAMAPPAPLRFGHVDAARHVAASGRRADKLWTPEAREFVAKPWHCSLTPPGAAETRQPLTGRGERQVSFPKRKSSWCVRL